MTKPIQLQTLEQITEPGERWLPVVGFDGYMVSDLGRVWSWKSERLLNRRITRLGYWCVGLYRSSKGRGEKMTVHRLVLDAFRGPNPNMMCRHLDSNRLNANLTNLAWGTAQDNADDIPHDTRAKRKQAHINNHALGIGVKLSPDNIRTIHSRFRDMKRTKASIAREFGVCEATIRAILKGEVWSWVR